MDRRLALLVALVLAWPANAHDLGVDLTLNGTGASANNPRSGSAGFGLSGSYDFNDRWTAFLTGNYVRDFATRAADSYSPGSNIFFLSAGVMFLPTDHVLLMATVTGAPPSEQRNATTFTNESGSADVVIRGTNSSLGGTLLVSYATGGLSNWEHTVDVSAGVNHFESQQQAELGTSLRARVFRTSCERNPVAGYCPLVNGLNSPLTQVRLGVAYTATISVSNDLGLDVAGFLYDTADPLGVGSFSAVVLGKQGPDMGLGVPVAPWRLTVRPSFLHRFGKFSVRASYQYGLYASNAGTNHLLSVKLSWKVQPQVRLTLSAIGQTDVDQRVVVNRGGTVTVGALFVFP